MNNTTSTKLKRVVFADYQLRQWRIPSSCLPFWNMAAAPPLKHCRGTFAGSRSNQAESDSTEFEVWKWQRVRIEIKPSREKPPPMELRRETTTEMCRCGANRSWWRRGPSVSATTVPAVPKPRTGNRWWSDPIERLGTGTVIRENDCEKVQKGLRESLFL